MTLIERIVELHQSLDAADIPHAFGGALALAWCAQQARGTLDFDSVVAIIAQYLGPDDPRIERLRSIADR